MRQAPFRAVVCAALAFAATYVFLDFNALHALRTNQNTGLYLQSLTNFAAHGTTFDQSDGRPHMAVHDQWIALPLAAAVALWPRPQTLIVAQVLALAAAAPVLFWFVRERGASATVAAAFALAYLLAPSTQGWAYHGFVPEDCLPLLAFVTALAVGRRSLPATLVACQLVLGVKEDEAYFVAWLGLCVTIFFDRRIGLAMLALGVLNGVTYYGLDRLAGYWPERPQYGLVDNDIVHQLPFVVEVLVPLGCAPLWLGPRIVAIAPFAAELFLTQDRTYPLYEAGSYYTVPFVTVCTLGAALVVARRPALARWSLVGAALMASFFNPTNLHAGRGLFSPDPLYPVAAAWGRSVATVDFPCEDAGAWTVAAANPNARLACPGTATAGVLNAPARLPRPAWRDVPLGSTAAWTRGPERESIR